MKTNESSVAPEVEGWPKEKSYQCEMDRCKSCTEMRCECWCHKPKVEPVEGVSKLTLCDTTMTPRASRTACPCATYPENLGPCERYEEGMHIAHCVYCDHRQSCHIAHFGVPNHRSEGAASMNLTKEQNGELRKSNMELADKYGLDLNNLTPIPERVSMPTSEATIEQRWNAEGQEAWCIIWGGKIIGFGAGQLGRKSCTEVLTRGDNLKGYYGWSDYTLIAKPPPQHPLSPQEEVDKVRKEFEGCITEIGANKTMARLDDYNKGWNDASDHAIKFIRRYIKGEGLFQL